VDTSSINLKRLLAKVGGEYDDRETTRALMHNQIVRLHQAICALPEIQRKAELEREQRKARRFILNTERQAANNEKAKINDVIWKKARRLLPVENASGNKSDWIIKLIWQVQQLDEKAAEFANHTKLICWLDYEDENPKLCAVPNDINDRLFRDQWSRGIPTILTSATLSAGAGASCAGDFTRTNQSLGLDKLKSRLSETTYPSPFNYRKNALLYLSENTPFPDSKNKDYIKAVTDEIERLVKASHGHAAVLFTSYDAMGRVFSALKQRNLPFPMFRLDKGGVKEIEKFKQSGNGILFASGSLWEGIDIPGDPLSMLIIVKLPFQVPDAIGEFERTQYPNFGAYLRSVLIPEMLVKLKQGFGRLIRTETDTGCVAILDCRVNGRGAYRERVLNTLPKCRVTADISQVEGFYKARKQSGYFI
jgi:ATP-dependent DNA helicase DinG